MTPNYPHAVSFSGGATSGYMLRRLMDANPDFDKKFTVIFENTGKEHDKTLDFVHDVETKWGIPIIWLEYCRIPALDIDPLLVPEGRRRKNLIEQQDRNESSHWWRQVRWETAARYYDSWTPFDELLKWASVLPNVRTRMCSVQLKLRTRNRYLWAQGATEFDTYIGIRKDEEHRKTEILANVEWYEHPHFPLCDDCQTHNDVKRFWDRQPFRLNIANFEGNCRLCYLKAFGKRVAVVKAEPESAHWWLKQEETFAIKADADGRFFKKSEPYTMVVAESEYPEFDFSKGEDVPCSCAVGGYRHSGDDES